MKRSVKFLVSKAVQTEAQTYREKYQRKSLAQVLASESLPDSTLGIGTAEAYPATIETSTEETKATSKV